MAADTALEHAAAGQPHEPSGSAVRGWNQAASSGVSPLVRREPWVRFAVVTALALAGCGDGAGDLVARQGPSAEVDRPPPDPASPFSLWLSADRVPPGPVEVVAVLVNHRGAHATFGVTATVERWDGDGWAEHRQLVMCMDHWHCTAEMVAPGGELESPALGLEATEDQPGPVERFTTDGLEAGWYRISQEANEGVVASGILEVADGAPTPAPLVAVGEAAISVQPPLVTPDGAVVTLSPLIPAPTGTKTIEDVETAVQGLTEGAAVDRWDGGAWEHVADVEPASPPPRPPDHSRSVRLPALSEGAYRLIRSGPRGDHVGPFWVAATDATP